MGEKSTFNGPKSQAGPDPTGLQPEKMGSSQPHDDGGARLTLKEGELGYVVPLPLSFAEYQTSELMIHR